METKYEIRPFKFDTDPFTDSRNIESPPFYGQQRTDSLKGGIYSSLGEVWKWPVLLGNTISLKSVFGGTDCQ